MKIVVLPAAYFPALGGSERTAQQIAEGLALRGHDVTVITADIISALGFYTVDSPATGKAKTENISGVKIRRIPLYKSHELTLQKRAKRVNIVLYKWLIKVLKLLSRIRFQGHIASELRQIQPDALIALPHLQPNVKIAISIASRLNIWIAMFPLVHSHDPYFPVRKLQIAVKKVDAVFAITHHEKKILTDTYGVDANKVVYSGLGVNYIDSPQDLCEEVGVPEILFIGRKTRGKGLGLLAEAARRVAERAENFRFVLVGAASSDSEDIAAEFRSFLADEQFIDKSNVSDEELWAWLCRCRVLVFPSKIESFGTVILEAWSARKPVITLDTPIFREIVEDGIDGDLVPSDSPETLASAILSFVNNKYRAEEMGHAGFLKLAKNYTWSDVIRRIEEALPDL